ncbi:MAG: hypothetical protein IKF29_00455 [Oceanobacillus sp.]|nr:hypothetical protein [Oceanobacillus sp.]
MINFDDEDIQKHFNECHFRQEVDGIDVCRGMCWPCDRTIEKGQCSMLTDYFSKQKGEDNG